MQSKTKSAALSYFIDCHDPGSWSSEGFFLSFVLFVLRHFIWFLCEFMFLVVSWFNFISFYNLFTLLVCFPVFVVSQFVDFII